MPGRGLDQRFTFDTFIVGAANRLAAAAARRVAESPGKAYNPLFLYSASGLGKTHLLMSIGHHATQRQPELRIVHDTAERAVHRIGTDDGGVELGNAQLLLLDDIQALAGERRAQDTLLVYWDELAARGAQFVLAADRPPTEIDRLDHRLLSRFSAGLIADIAPPDYEMRVDLVRRRAEERGHKLAPGVAESISRVAFANVRELQGGLNRVIAAQELDGKPVKETDVASLLGFAMDRNDSEEFDSFLSEVTGAVVEIATRVTPEQRLVDAILRYEGEGYRTYRLEMALRHPPSEREVAELCDRFAADVERLASITQEIKALDEDAPELSRSDLLRNPDRALEAETLLAQVHERLRPLPEPEAGPGLDDIDLPPDNPALDALRVIAKRPGARAVPLYVRGPGDERRIALLEGLARDVRRDMPMLPIALLAAGNLASELDAALRSERADTWRARYRRARLVVVDAFDTLDAPAAIRDEIFRFLDGVRRSGGQIVLAGEIDPTTLNGTDDKLAALAGESDVADIVVSAARPVENTRMQYDVARMQDTWYSDPEKTLARWPYVEDWLVTELD